jgi:predicted NBD/HSP70 family sugar kinase
MTAAPGSLEGLRRLNRTRVLDEVQRRGGTTRVDLVRSTGLSRTTVSSLVAGLLEDGVLVERSEAPARAPSPAGGRPPIQLTLNPDSGTVIGAHFGHDGAQVAIADLTGTIIDVRTRALDVDHLADESLSWAVAAAGELLAAADRTWASAVGMGVAVSAPLPDRDRRLPDRSLLPDWQGRDVAAELSAQLDLPVHVENDANLGAVAEWTFGAGRGVDDLVYVMVSDGVGAGLVLDGRLHRGVSGTAGEVGHLVVVPDGTVCRCGNRGCLETVAGGAAIAQALAHLHGSAITLEGVVALAVAGDSGARRVLADAGSAIGEVVAALCTVLDPRLVIVGGKASAAGEVLLGAVRNGLRRRLSPAIAGSMKVVPGTLGDRAELLGAIALAGRSAPTRLIELGGRSR